MKPIQKIFYLLFDDAAKQAVDTFCDLHGMMQITVVSRLLNWFLRQDEVVQATILGALSKPADVANASLTILRRLADAEEKQA